MIRDANAICLTCGKEWHGPNCWGVAARHAKAHGHKTAVEVLSTFVYGEDKT